MLSSPSSGDGSISVNAFTPTTTCSPDSMRRVRSDSDRTSRPLISSMASNAPPSDEHILELGPGGVAELCRAGFHDHRAVEDVVVLEQVGLECEHLLHAQRPLLIPRSRQAERLVPRWQLDRSSASTLRQRDPEHLEHDALHVVLGLGLGEAERVHLHAVAEPAQASSSVMP